ncbi:hypothetical protein Aperf_G00000035033 [Anoplocephala perfoliata]
MLPFSLFVTKVIGFICSFLCKIKIEYSSSDSDEESHEKGSLVLPPFTCDIKGDTVRFLEPSKSSESTGLVRSFAHQHGNWATSVYLPATEALTRFLYTLMDLVKPLLSQSNREFYICEEFHLSLSRTWPILHHWIAGFERMLHDISTKYPRPFVKLEKADFLVNDEGTRSFLVVCVEKSDFFVNLLSEIDPVVVSYRGEPYYKDQIFHFSLSWCIGNVNSTVSPDWKEACLVMTTLFFNDILEINFSFLLEGVGGTLRRL